MRGVYYAQIFCAWNKSARRRAIIRGRDAEHIKVLRLRPGEEMTICDGNGTDYKCRLVRSDKDEAEAEIIEVVPCAARAYGVGARAVRSAKGR